MIQSIRAVEAGYDLTIIKRVQSMSSRDLALQLVTMGAFAGVFWAVFGDIALLWWYCAFITVNGLFAAVARRLPDRIGGRALVLVLGLVAAESMVSLTLAAYLWLHAEAVLNMLGLMLAMGASVVALSERSEDPILRWDAAIWMALFAIGIPILWLLREGVSRDWVLLAVSSGLWLVYFEISLAEAGRMRRRLSAAHLAAFEQSRVESLGRLTGGVAHDFNNILTVIGGNLDLAEEVADPHEKRALLAEARRATERAAGVTAQLLAYSRQSVLTPADVDVVQSLQRVETFLRRLLPDNLTLLVAPDGQLPSVRVDQTRFESALINLVLNARDAMRDGGNIVVTAALRDLPRAALPTDLEPGRYLYLSVRDHGTGIDPAILSKVVEPYFTTKAIGQGSGLGLSMAKGFAEQSGGGLLIASELGKGTEVRLFFPPVTATDDRLILPERLPAPAPPASASAPAARSLESSARPG